MSIPTTPELTYGSLVLHPASSSGYSTFAIEVTTEGTEWGKPEAVVEVVNSLLQDGSLAQVTRHDNRTVPVRVRVMADTYDGLAEGEQRLFTEVQKAQNMLTWLPPVIDAIPTVFVVVAGDLGRDHDDSWDLDETRLRRHYLLTLTCAPFARSLGETEVEALPAPPSSPTTVSIDTCDSATGWTGVGSSGPTASGGGVHEQSTPAGTIAPHASLVRTGAVTMGATPYLTVDYTAQISGTVSFKIDDVSILPSAQEALVGGNLRVYLEPPASFTTLSVAATHAGGATGGEFTLTVYDVSRTDTLATSGTNRQRAFTLDVQGSARTQASLVVYSDSGQLGDETLIYTRPATSALQPPLRKWRTSSAAVSADAALVSGAFNGITSTPMVCRIPADLLTEGTYALMARLRADSDSGPRDVTWSVALRDPANVGTGYGPVTSGTTTVTLLQVGALVGAFEILDLARLALPPVRVQNGSKYVAEVQLSADLPTSIDEAWLFNLDTGALSWVNTSADDDPISALRINVATLAHPRPEYQVAVDPDLWQDGRNADHRVRAWGTHTFEPGLMDVFTVTTESLEAQVSMSYFRRWHTHARA